MISKNVILSERSHKRIHIVLFNLYKVQINEMLNNIYFRATHPWGRAIRKSKGIRNRKPKTVDISGREVWECDKEDPV